MNRCAGGFKKMVFEFILYTQGVALRWHIRPFQGQGILKFYDNLKALKGRNTSAQVAGLRETGKISDTEF
jgi:hypothetical protein